MPIISSKAAGGGSLPSPITTVVEIVPSADDGNPLLVNAPNGGTHQIAAFQGQGADVGAVVIDKKASMYVESGTGAVQAAFAAVSDNPAKNALETWDPGFNNLTVSISAAGVLRVVTGGIVFPTADPHVAGAWWDNAGTLTKSAG